MTFCSTSPSRSSAISVNPGGRPRSITTMLASRGSLFTTRTDALMMSFVASFVRSYSTSIVSSSFAGGATIVHGR